MIQLVVDITQQCRLETLSHLTFSNLYEAIHIKIFTSIKCVSFGVLQKLFVILYRHDNTEIYVIQSWAKRRRKMKYLYSSNFQKLNPIHCLALQLSTLIQVTILNNLYLFHWYIVATFADCVRIFDWSKLNL